MQRRIVLCLVTTCLLVCSLATAAQMREVKPPSGLYAISVPGDWQVQQQGDAVQAVAPGGIAGSELGIRVTYHVPNLMAPLAGMFPGLPHGDFTGDATAIFRQEGW
jgi:hypothetical protein